MSVTRQWWVHDKHKRQDIGPFNSREAAAKEFFDYHDAEASEVLTGYGAGGAWFDIRWVKRNETASL